MCRFTPLTCSRLLLFFAAMSYVGSIISSTYAEDVSGLTGFIAYPENGSKVSVLRDNETYLDVSIMGWGPNWSWMGFRGTVQTDGEATLMENTASFGGAPCDIRISIRVEKTGDRQVRLHVEAQADQDVPLTYLILAVEPTGEAFHENATYEGEDSSGPIIKAMPLGKQELGASVSKFALRDHDAAATRFELAPPLHVVSDNAIRIILAEERLAGGEPIRAEMKIDFTDDFNYYASSDQIPSDPAFDDWFPFTPDGDHEAASEIGMEDWLERPAGRHGRIVRREDELIYNGRPIKLWGLNVCYSSCAPDHDLADRRAAFYAKYGVNAVRLHKYADGSGWAGIQSEESFTEFDPEGLERMDYFIARLKERGIYVKFSAHFGSQKLGPGDRRYVPYLEEFGEFSGSNSRITTPHSAVHYSPELQDVQIRQMINLLVHKNPYTGMTYAEDSAVSFLEIINEQSILFYSSMSPLQASPTLRHDVAQRFCDWLRAKYGTQEELEAAWGVEAFDSFTSEGFPDVGERLDQNNILPLGNPWYWDPDQLAGSESYRRTRLMDTMLFLYGLQNEFYDRYVQAVRDAGYGGEIVSSNWQAGRAYSHLLNLHSDARVGAVDRHNYFGGGSSGRIANATMLASPGSGMLSSGMQQVADRPFMLSEWIHVSPNEWGVEGPALLGAYGMGLQGWDVSYIFQNRDAGRITDRVGTDSWNATDPQIIGVFPAVARQVLRGDVRESDLETPCIVHLPSLADGRLGFSDSVTQAYDVKSFGSVEVPAETLAVARCGVEFTDAFEETAPFNPTQYIEDERYHSSTNELAWRPGESKLDGGVTINTDATKAVIGFENGRTHELGDVSIRSNSRYAAVYITAQEPDRTIATSNNLLIVAMARARNTGMNVFQDERILVRGESPIVLEPVRAEIAIRKSGEPTIHVLDHDGRKTGRTLPLVNGRIEIDGTRDQTCYYLVEYK